MCSMAAAVQGMDETVNNGAQAIYLKVRVSSLREVEDANRCRTWELLLNSPENSWTTSLA